MNIKKRIIKWAFKEICKAGLVGTNTINTVGDWLEEEK